MFTLLYCCFVWWFYVVRMEEWVRGYHVNNNRFSNRKPRHVLGFKMFREVFWYGIKDLVVIIYVGCSYLVTHSWRGCNISVELVLQLKYVSDLVKWKRLNFFETLNFVNSWQFYPWKINFYYAWINVFAGSIPRNMRVGRAMAVLKLRN